MQFCCVCQFQVRNPRNIFSESIGSPPILISELVLKCTRGTDFEIPVKSSICKKCCEKLSRYYKSLEIAKQIRQEILDLIRSPYIMEEFKSSKGGSRVDTKTDTEDTCGTEFIIEMEKDDGEQEIEEKITAMIPEGELRGEYQIIELDVMDNDEIVVEELEEEVEKYEYDQVTEVGYEEEHLQESECEEKEIDEQSLSQDDEYENEDQIDMESQFDSNGELKCPNCDETFKTKRKLNAHLKRDHFPGYVCDQCGKTLQSHSGFLGHLQNHKDVKQFQCPECGECFKRKFRLKHHMAWHSGEKPFQCDVCSKQFVHKVALYKHKMIHDDETKRMECQVCGFKFRTKAHLDRHMRAHTGVKPFTCPVCKKQFSQMYNMKTHLKEHESPGCTKQKRFRCQKCAHTFVNVQRYQDHCNRGFCIESSQSP